MGWMEQATSASLDLLIELYHLLLLPISFEKTAFKDVQMKMYWKESTQIHMINQ